MRPETEQLLEHVLHAVMQPDSDALTLAMHLRSAVPEARVIALIHALLSADRVIRDTFNGNAPARADAALASGFALTLAEVAEAHEARENPTRPVTLRDLAL
ncbi:hypothetical protein [Hasllibacter sp. MH4015]|uniref:hypothetical protein n=1 Tax=Hasllibacter sp. MH4015 TaxID=2854029 RepID=UPI001CD2CE3C|nr:hypothetical protein [Hasllibacter sp. MH4015]